MELTEEDKDTVERVLTDVQQCTVLEANRFVEFKPVNAQFGTALHNLQQRGPPEKQWVQYFKMNISPGDGVHGVCQGPCCMRLV